MAALLFARELSLPTECDVTGTGFPTFDSGYTWSIEINRFFNGIESLLHMICRNFLRSDQVRFCFLETS